RPLAARINASDWARGGVSDDEAIELAAALQDRGCDLLDVVAGQTVPNDRPEFHRLFLLPFSDLIRNEVGIPAMTSGNITTADQVNTILAAGRADLCVLDPRVLGERTQDVSHKNA